MGLGVVQAGTLFDYLAAFITILLALAVGDLALSLHRLLRARRTIHWHPLPLVAAFWVFLVLLTSFFGLWPMTEMSRVTYYALLWFVVPQVCYFLAASAVLPDEVTPELDLEAFYFAERRYLFAVLATAFTVDMIDDLLREGQVLTAAPARAIVRYFAVNAITLVAFAAMWKSARRWVHWLGFAALFIAAVAGFSGWEIRGEPASSPAQSSGPASDSAGG